MGRENRYIYIVCRVIHTYIQRIHYKLPFTLSNKVELFELMQSPGLRNAIFMCGYTGGSQDFHSLIPSPYPHT